MTKSGKYALTYFCKLSQTASDTARPSVTVKNSKRFDPASGVKYFLQNASISDSDSSLAQFSVSTQTNRGLIAGIFEAIRGAA